MLVNSAVSIASTNSSTFLDGLLRSSPNVVKWGIGFPVADSIKIIIFVSWNLPTSFKLFKNVAMSLSRSLGPASRLYYFWYFIDFRMTSICSLLIALMNGQTRLQSYFYILMLMIWSWNYNTPYQKFILNSRFKAHFLSYQFKSTHYRREIILGFYYQPVIPRIVYDDTSKIINEIGSTFFEYYN